jgi:hypothetical protein
MHLEQFQYCDIDLTKHFCAKHLWVACRSVASIILAFNRLLYLEICSRVKMFMKFCLCGLMFHRGRTHCLSMWADLSHWQDTPRVNVDWPFAMAGHTTCQCGLTFHTGRTHHLSECGLTFHTGGALRLSTWANISHWLDTPYLQFAVGPLCQLPCHCWKCFYGPFPLTFRLVFIKRFGRHY